MGFLKSDLFTRRCEPRWSQTVPFLSVPLCPLWFKRTLTPPRRRRCTKENLVRDHPLHLVQIGITHQGGRSQLFLALLRFRSQDVTQKSFAPLDLPGPSLLEALGSTSVCFQFRHKNLLSALSCRLSAKSSSLRSASDSTVPIAPVDFTDS
jgi:hypothetical protein